MIYIMIRKFRLIPTKTSLFNCGVYNGILNYFLKSPMILKLPAILSLFNVVFTIPFSLVNGLFKVIIGLILIYVLFYLLALLGIVIYILGYSKIIEFNSSNMSNPTNDIESSSQKVWLNWKTPSQEYPYSNYTNLELDQIHKYFEAIDNDDDGTSTITPFKLDSIDSTQLSFSTPVDDSNELNEVNEMMNELTSKLEELYNFSESNIFNIKSIISMVSTVLDYIVSTISNPNFYSFSLYILVLSFVTVLLILGLMSNYYYTKYGHQHKEKLPKWASYYINIRININSFTNKYYMKIMLICQLMIIFLCIYMRFRGIA